MLRVQVGVLLLILIMTIGYMEVPPTPVGVYNDEASDTSSHEYYDKFYVHDYLRFVSRDVSPAPSVMSTYDPQQDTRSLKSLWTKKPVTNPSTPRNRSEHHLLIKPEPMQRDDLFYTGPADYEEQQHSKENLEGKEIILQGSDRHTRKAQYGLAHIHKSDEMEANKSNHSLQSKQSTKSGKSRIFRRTNSKFMRGLTTLFDYHMLSQFEFRVLVASAFLYPMGFNIPFVYSKVRTTIPPSQAAFIGPAIGISNFAVRIVCGFVAFKRRSLTTSTCGGGLIFGGAFVFLSAFYGKDKFWFQIVYGLCYGVAPAVYSTLRAIIYVKYVGLSKLTNAFGICALAMGLGVFIGTTVGGMLVGLTDDYTGPFAFAGLCIIVSGLLKLTLPKMVEMRKRKREG
ncbi:hypothetical protein KR018_004601 [Drosophila ironensis]|nr:hypothetical protein KR018_004601 [Drosophila ironensis]